MSVRLLPDTTDEQRMMLDAVVRAIETGCPLPAVRELAERSEPAGAALRRSLGELGCFGLLAGEDRGGGSLSGNGVLDAALVAAERGARLQPGPFVGTHVAVDTLARVAAAPQRLAALEALVAGEAAATWAAAGLLGQPGGSALTVRETDGGFVLTGLVSAVQDADECDWILISAPADGGGAADGGVRHFLLARTAGGLSLEKVESLDITRRFFDLRLAEVHVPAWASLADPADGAALADRQIAVAAVLSAAESVGAMDANFQLAVEYSRTRIAFGRPIGSFQALKHLLADSSLLVEMAKALVAGAAEALGRDAVDGPAMAAAARAFVSENSVEVTHNCFQVFGGIGYTWEHDQHLFMRRLAAEAYLFGAPSWHRRRLWQQGVLAGDGAKEAADV